MARVFWDTNLFVYLIEDVGPRAVRVAELRTSMHARGDELVTSALTLAEVLVRPVAMGKAGLARDYERLICGSATVIPFDVDTARSFAAIRATENIKAPDAIQLACAAHARIDLFITNDDRLSRKVIPGIQFITSLDRAFL